jgi:endonuclease YncB( thermonuclease family)
VSFPDQRPYVAYVVRVVDGDTIVCDIDLGLRTWLRGYKVRLIGCNSAELSTEAGKAARDHLADILPEGTKLTLSMVKDYKYGGEFVAGVFLNGFDLVVDLIVNQWAAPWDGRGAAPVPPWPRSANA